MISTILLAMLEIFVLFLLFVFSREFIKDIFKLKICAICASVALTWITMLILKFAEVVTDDLLIGILMGGSVVGIMYAFEQKIKKVGKEKLSWLKILIIIFSVSFVYLLLSETYNWIFWLILLSGIGLFIYIIASVDNLPGKKNERWVVETKHGKFSEEIKNLEEKFEHCCD